MTTTPPQATPAADQTDQTDQTTAPATSPPVPGPARALGEATIQELRQSVRGHVITPAEDGYLSACTIWNGAHDGRRPALIVRCAGTADVMTAVGFARSHHLPLAVRGGGHSMPGFSTCDDSLVIDLSPIRYVRVDPARRRAWVGGGAVWSDVDHETQAHGLATTGGLVSTTGVAGFTLGGGIGWLMRRHGLACDNLIAADLVTADATLLHVTETDQPDLMWALRGGGGNFGVVTQFEFTLHPVGPTVYAGPVFYPAAAAADLLHRLRGWAPTAHPDITALINLTTAPPLPVIPSDWHGRPVAALVAVSAGPVEDGPTLIQDLRPDTEPVADLLGPMPYTVIQSLLDPLWPRGIHAYFKATNLAHLDDQIIDTLVRHHQDAPGPQCEIHVHQMGGAVAAAGDDTTAFGERTMPYVLNAVTGWHDPTAADTHRTWARTLIDATSHASTGHAYTNFLGDPTDTHTAYSPRTHERLTEIKTTYDPTNLFRLNQNIQPVHQYKA